MGSLPATSSAACPRPQAAGKPSTAGFQLTASAICAHLRFICGVPLSSGKGPAAIVAGVSMQEQVAGASNFGFSGVDHAAEGRQLTYIAAISEALRDEMRRDPRVLVLGEDIAGDFGGAFKVTRGFEAEFGSRRVINTPIAELGFTGMATGMALMGLRPVVEMQFADFISTAFDSIVQFAASAHYRHLGAVPWVVRAPSDGGLRSGPFHSQNPEAWFVHTPGLKVVAPGTPADAKGLLIAAIRDDNPVIFFESKPLYRTMKGHVPAGEYVVPIGQAHVARRGEALSIITYGTQLREALSAAERLAAEHIECEVLDLRTLKPLDTEAILSTVRRTSKALIVHSANQLAGVGAEVAALIAQHAFESLDAPVIRLGGLDTPVPFSPPLEDAYRPDAQRIFDAARALASY
jgi:2-oxoisovalerate dehydrogenase E1 component beta subunit